MRDSGVGALTDEGNEHDHYVVVSSVSKLKEGMEAPVNSVPIKPATGISPTSARATRYAIKFDPPTFCLEYQDVELKKRVRAVSETGVLGNFLGYSIFMARELARVLTMPVVCAGQAKWH